MMKGFGQKARLASGVLLLLAGLSLQLQGISALISIPVMVAGMIFLLRAARILKEGKESVKGDERTRKLGAFASAYSWFLTLVLVCLLFWADYLELAEIPLQHALGLVIFFMIISLLGFRWHFTQKGDAE